MSVGREAGFWFKKKTIVQALWAKEYFWPEIIYRVQKDGGNLWARFDDFSKWPWVRRAYLLALSLCQPYLPNKVFLLNEKADYNFLFSFFHYQFCKE